MANKPRNYISRCIPAGMQINIIEDIRDELGDIITFQKKTKTKKQRATKEHNSVIHDEQLYHQNQCTSKIVSTIRNKTVTQFDAEPSHSRSHIVTVGENINTSKTNIGTNLEEDANLPLKEKILRRIRKSEHLTESKKSESANAPPVHNQDKTCQDSNRKEQVEKSLKDKIAERLQKSLDAKGRKENQRKTINAESQQNEDQGCKKSYPLLKESIFIKQPEITKIVNNKTILHGVVIPKPIFSLDNTYFDESVQKALKTMDCSSAKDIQSYMWPAVQRGLNVFMVGPRGIGKTLSYLPVLCSFSIDKDEKYSDLVKYEGPIIVILCPENKRCESLQNLIKSLICDSSISVVVEVITDDIGLQGRMCDIMITTPQVLERCLLSETIKLRRLCHVAIEDAHVVLKSHSQSMGKLFTILNELQINRPHNKNIQVIISSTKWSVDIETVLKKLYATPLVCIEDFLEAAIYSKINFKKKNINSKYKWFYLDDILKTNFMSKRTVVFCNESEIARVGEHLQISGVECIAISENLIEDEIFENEDMWCSLQSGSFKVLLITDAVFEKIVHVRHAHWLVHLYLPKNWVQFSKRFRCLAGNFHSPLSIDEHISQTESLNSFLILDEFCDSQLLDFFDLLTRNSVMHVKI